MPTGPPCLANGPAGPQNDCMTPAAAPDASWSLFGSVIGALLVLFAALGAVMLRSVMRLRAALSHLRALWRFWLQAAEDRALIELDAAGNICAWNSGAQRLHGYESEQILARPYAELFAAEERSARVPQNELEIAARAGRHRSRGWRRRRDGTRLYSDTLIEARRDRAGRLKGFAISEQDVSEVLQRQQALEQARESLTEAQRLAALGQLSDGIAHEFNNVVQVISTCVQALQRGDMPAARASELLQMIKRNAERAAELSQHLLNLAGRRSPSPAPTDVNAVVSEVVSLLRQTLSEDIVVDLQVHAGLAWAVIDRGDLEAALVNLAAAARDSMPRGGTLSMSTTEVRWPVAGAEREMHAGARHYVLISVRCSGEANPEQGLQMVRSFAERSGGRLEIDAEQTGCATAKLYLPCQAA